jgi:hypothetical protein
MIGLPSGGVTVAAAASIVPNGNTIMSRPLP